MQVVEIFKSIEGEGKRTGLPTTFIRFYGCSLRCSYCDTKYSYEGTEYKNMTVDEIIAEVEALGCQNITITGGEPLFQLDLLPLLKKLFKAGNYWVNIETNGAEDLAPVISFRESIQCNLFLTVDYKCISSGMHNQMWVCNYDYLNSEDVVKFVVADEKDLECVLEFLKCYEGSCQFYISPVFGKIDPKDLVDFVLLNHLDNVHVQLQLHKIIWDPETRGV